MFYSLGIFRTSSPGDSISDDTERSSWRKQWKKSGYIKFATKGTGRLESSKYFCELKRIRHLKLRNLVLSYVWKDARVWAH